MILLTFFNSMSSSIRLNVNTFNWKQLTITDPIVKLSWIDKFLLQLLIVDFTFCYDSSVANLSTFGKVKMFDQIFQKYSNKFEDRLKLKTHDYTRNI